jgi:hypothetical protein
LRLSSGYARRRHYLKYQTRVRVARGVFNKLVEVNGFPPTLTAEPYRLFGPSRWTNYPSSNVNADSR